MSKDTQKIIGTFDKAYYEKVITEKKFDWGHFNRHRYEAILNYGGKSVLDVGCASGIYVEKLTERSIFAVGVDYYMHEFLSAGKRKGLFLSADAQKLPFKDESFDTISCFETLEHLPNPQEALLEFKRVCKKNVIITVPNCELPDELRKSGLAFHHYVDRSHINMFTKERLTTILEECGFVVKLCELINRTHAFKLCLLSLGFPEKLAHFLDKAFYKLLRAKPFYMTILAVGVKKV
ncbi:class I SAM-dependent methyltransferase [Candidatus Sumerlaeota bacterium]|nr:class I SAM-dependent methyltransferase [Candidatus Sumerlaeota bacterium]